MIGNAKEERCTIRQTATLVTHFMGRLRFGSTIHKTRGIFADAAKTLRKAHVIQREYGVDQSRHFNALQQGCSGDVGHGAVYEGQSARSVWM